MRLFWDEHYELWAHYGTRCTRTLFHYTRLFYGLQFIRILPVIKTRNVCSSLRRNTFYLTLVIFFFIELSSHNLQQQSPGRKYNRGSNWRGTSPYIAVQSCEFCCPFLAPDCEIFTVLTTTLFNISIVTLMSNKYKTNKNKTRILIVSKLNKNNTYQRKAFVLLQTFMTRSWNCKRMHDLKPAVC